VKESSIRRIAACVLVALLIPLGAAAAEPPKPGSQVIDALHDALLDVMKRATELGYEGREEKLAPIVPEYFDVPFMARKSVGRYWKELSEEDQRRFLGTFTRFMIANYAGQFDGYSGQSFETLGEEPARMETVVVKSRLVDPNGDDVELNYRMRQVGEKWKIVDVYLDGTVSELALRRSEFSSIIKREGFEALIAAIDAKITKLASGSDAT